MRLFCLACVLLSPAVAQAYRPFTGTDADVAADGEVELEIGAFGWLHQHARDALVAPALIANYGLMPRVELVLEGRQFVSIDPAPGEQRLQLLDTALSVKGILREGVLQEKTGPSIAVEGSVLLPETGATRPGGEVTVILSQRWEAMTVHWNAAAALTRASNFAAFAGVIVEGPGRWTVRPVAEVFVEHENGGATEISGLGGAIWRLSETLSIDAAMRLSRVAEGGKALANWEGRAGLTWGFEVLARRNS